MELYGRRTAYTAKSEITADNVVSVLNKALEIHTKNIREMDYLYWYRRGKTPIRNREKEVRPEICAKTNINHSEEIVAFKNGYFLTQPAFYVARGDADSAKIANLNEYLYRSGKQDADNELVDWFHTVGKATLYVTPNEDPDVPVKCYAIDPRSAFVVYSLSPDHRPMMGVNMVVDDDKTVYFDCYTENSVFRMTGGFLIDENERKSVIGIMASSVEKIEHNMLKKIPIIEYKYNSVGMGAFEPTLDLLDSIDKIVSNRIDGIEQFVQSLVVTTNCQFEDGVDANTIMQAGMINLTSTNENRAEFNILSQQLDQAQTQVAIDDLYEQVLNICGMPAISRDGGSTSDNGVAVLARNGWYQADVCARNTEDLFKVSNKYFDEILLGILNQKKELGLKITDFELHFARNETSNCQSKAQTLQTLLSAGMHPELAFAKSGISNDPVADVEKSTKYLEMIWGNPNEPKEEQTEVVVEETEITTQNDGEDDGTEKPVTD